MASRTNPTVRGNQPYDAPHRKRRDVPWDELRQGDLSERQARALGEEWRARMVQEHLAVGAFSELAHELAEGGCEMVVLSMVTRAAADEVRHGELCRRVATAFVGEVSPSRLSGVPKIPAYPGAPVREKALLHLVEMGCMSETLTGVYLTKMLSRAENPAMRAAIGFLLQDEIDHGRLGWAHLAACVRDGDAGCVAPALPVMLERTMADVMSAPLPSAPRDPVLESYGQISLRDAKGILSETLRAVILPGFESLGIDVGSAREHVRARGWF